MAKKSKPYQPRPPDVTLNAILDLREAAPLAERLLARRGTDLVIDGGAVQRLGGQCLQVLLSARATWTADGRNFLVGNISPAIVATLELLGIALADLNNRAETTG